jgi:putative ABC transport system permease protein
VKPGSLASGSLPEIYQPFAVAPDNDIFFILRTAAPVPGLPAAIRAAVSRIDAEQAVSYIRPLSSWVERSTARQRFAMILFLAFSGVALLLAASGLYGVMAYSVSQRTSEIGVRRALGARTADVLALVFAQGVRLVGLGLLAGVLGAALLSRFLERLLFKVSAHDPLTFAAVVSILVAVAGLGCLLPARRASRVDPMVALRSQ